MKPQVDMSQLSVKSLLEESQVSTRRLLHRLQWPLALVLVVATMATLALVTVTKEKDYDTEMMADQVRTLQVYFFNLTNAEAVFKGLEKPKLVEVGPYTYTQKWTKQNITWHKNGTVSYRTRKIFT